jgi:transposase
MSKRRRIKTEKGRLRRREEVLSTFQEQGSIRGTARELRISVNTVRKVLREQDTLKSPQTRSGRVSKLEPYRARMRTLVQEEQWSARLVFEEIQKLGYSGGYSLVKEYVRQIRPQSPHKVTTVLEHPPGAEGQVDWSPYTVEMGGTRCVVHAFSLQLPYSRWGFIRMALDQKIETLLALHDEAFAQLGGIPCLMTYDNMTTVGRHISKDEVWINPRFEAYRNERNKFDILLIDPGCPNQHAIVERIFHYFENNCLRRRGFRFDDFQDLQDHVSRWCDEVANVRIHGSTRERPVDRLLRERPLLLPFPQNGEQQVRKLSREVQSDFCVAVDTNRYSVSPRHVKKPATIFVYADTIEVRIDGQVAAIHPRCFERHQRKTLPEHEAEFKKVSSSRLVLEQAFLRLGPTAEDYYRGLRVHRGRGAGYHLQRILKLSDRYGVTTVLGAMAHAARFGNYSAEAVANVLRGRELSQQSASTPSAPPPPERVKRWLEGLYVEQKDLQDYDRLIHQLQDPDEDNHD